MALYTPSEFAELLQCKLADLSTYKIRKKVVINDNNQYDTDNEINRLFILKRKDYLSKKEAKASGADIVIPSAPSKLKKEAAQVAEMQRQHLEDTAEDIETTNEPGTQSNSYNQLSIKKLQTDIQKGRADTQLKHLQIEKFQGRHIPTDVVGVLLAQYHKNMVTEFHQAADNMLVDFSAVHNLTSEQTATLRGAIIAHINTGGAKAIDATKKQLKQIVNDYALSRTKGQKKI